jgi:two-component sensor histidine kinase
MSKNLIQAFGSIFSMMIRYLCHRKVSYLLTRSSYRVKSFQKAHYSSKELDDFKLHNSWNLTSLLQAMMKVAYDEDAQKAADSMIERGIVNNPAEAVVLRADLDSPLLQKYKFDVYDFYSGAKVSSIDITPS